MSKRIGAWLIGLGAGLLVIVAAAWFALPSWLLRRIEAEARVAGVELSNCTLAFSFSQLELTECNFGLIQLPEFRGRVDSIAVALEGFEPHQVSVDGLHAELGRLDTNLLEQLRAVVSSRGENRASSALPLTVSNSDLNVASGPLSQFGLEQLRFDSRTFDFAGRVRGPSDLAGDLTGTRTMISVRVQHAPSGAAANVRLDGSNPSEGTLSGDYANWTVPLLTSLFDLKVPSALQDARLNGQVYAQLAQGLSRYSAKGDFRTSIAGVTLPVPAELVPLVAASTLDISGTFTVANNDRVTKFAKLAFTAGSLRLAGSGQLELEETSTPYSATLRGQLSCVEVAKAAASVHTTGELKQALQRLSKSALAGSIGVGVRINGTDVRRLREAQVTPSISPGCGLHDEILANLGRDLQNTIDTLEPLPPPTEAAQRIRDRVDEVVKELPRLKLPTLPLPGRPRSELIPNGGAPPKQEVPQD